MGDEIQRPYIRLVSSFIDHPEFVDLSLEEIGLWVWAVCYANNHLTDGFIPTGALRRAGTCADRSVYLANCLVSTGRFNQVVDGYQVVNFERYNRTRDEVNRLVDKRKAAGKIGGLASAAKRSKSSTIFNPETETKAETETDLDHAELRTGELFPDKADQKHPDYAAVVATYFAEFERVRNAKPKFGSRDGKAAKQLIDACGSGESASETIRRAFRNQWFATNKGTLSYIVSHLNEFIAQAPKSAPMVSTKPSWWSETGA